LEIPPPMAVQMAISAAEVEQDPVHCADSGHAARTATPSKTNINSAIAQRHNGTITLDLCHMPEATPKRVSSYRVTITVVTSGCCCQFGCSSYKDF
jgi:hypothetical protein